MKYENNHANLMVSHGIMQLRFELEELEAASCMIEVNDGYLKPCLNVSQGCWTSNFLKYIFYLLICLVSFYSRLFLVFTRLF